MKKIVGFGLLVLFLVGYFLPVPQVRIPADKTIVYVKGKVKEWWWLFHSGDCGPIEERQKGYCGGDRK